MECIDLKNMIFHAYHGVLEEERITGNIFRIDIKLFLDLNKAKESDNLEDTINYADIYSLIKEEMQIASNLLEHVAGRIIRKIKQEYPQISKINIRLAKKKPPIDGNIQEAAVIISECNHSF